MTIKSLVVLMFLAVTVTVLSGAEAPTGQLETGENFIANGLVKIEVPKPPERNAILMSAWNPDTKSWSPLLSGTLGVGMDEYFEMLLNEPAEQIKAEKTADAAALTFTLTDRTKDSRGKGGDASFFQTYRITLNKGSHSALVELFDEAEGGKGQTKWGFGMPPARYIVGKAYGTGDFYDCQEAAGGNKTLQLNAGDKYIGGFNPETGALTLVYQPKLYYVLGSFGKEGLARIWTIAQPFTLYVNLLGAKKDVAAAVAAAEQAKTSAPGKP